MDKTDVTKPMHDTRADSLSPTERQKILYDWNDTAFDYPRHLTLHDLISAQAGRTPDKIAVVYETEQLTYRELEQRSNQLARYLMGRGVSVESLAGIYMDRSSEMIVGILGILKAGGAYVPIDPELPPARIQMMMEDASPAVVLTQEALLSNLDTERTATVCMDRDWSQIAAEPTDPLSVEMTSRNLAYVVYTSGSTGRPKGAQNEHRAAVNLMHSMARRVGITADDVILATTTISFDPSVWEIFLPLTTGATLVVAPQESMIDGARLQRIIEDNGVTFMRSTPTGWRIYLETGWRGTDGLKVLSGGENLTLDLARELQQRSAVLWHTYGPAEAAVFCTMGIIPPDAEVVSIGRPHDNIRIYLLDEALEPVAVGEIGELYIAGDGVGRGYHNRPELTSERFLPEPFVSHEGEEQPRMYRTGDLARFLPDGQIVFVGRNDSQVKLHGRRIELGDIEAAIHRHPAIAQNLVLAREDTPGDIRLVAYLIPRPGRKAPDAGEMRHFLGRTLPAYMTPARFVVLERFPVSPNGKIDRLALPAPDRRGDEFENSYVEPRTQREARMAALFAEVLNLERVSVTQSFFDLGGNSLLAARLIYRVQDTFDVKVTLRDFFAEPTVSGLSKTVDSTSKQGERAVGSEPAAAAPTNGAVAAPQQADALLEQSNLTQNQFLMWLGQQMNPDVPLYNVVHAFTIHGALEPAAFGRAFQAFVDHHDALRTVFRTINGVPRQEVLETVEAGVEYIDLAREADPDAAYRAFEAERKMRILSLDEPLFDCVLLKLADDRTVWYLGQHHIMTDAISAELAFERVAAYYQLALDDRLGDIAEPPQYRAFVDYEHGLRQTAAHQDALTYWREKYGKPLPPTEFYGQTAPEASFHTERMTYRLGKRRSDSLRAIARQAGFVSPSEDMSLFTIFATLLFATVHRLNGQQTMRVGTPFHGRPTTEAMDIIGLFIELGAIQVDVGEGETFVSLGEQVMAETLEGLAHVQPGMSSAEANSAFDMVLNFIQSSYGEFAGLPVTKEPTHTNHIDAAHNLRLQIIDYDNSGDFVLLFDLKTELFGPSERSWLVEHFVRVLDTFIDNPTRSLGDFSLINETDRDRLLVAFNDTDAAYPADRTVVALFEEQAARSPGQVAVVDGDATLTYEQFNERANQLAHYLTSTYNVGPGATVAICMPRSIDALVAIWGVLKAGGAYVPIDPTYPEERIAFMVADAGPDVVLTRDVEAIAPLVPATVIDPAGLDLTGCAETNPEAAAAPDDLAYMIYTSGSTGQPKGAMITHRGLLNYAWWARRVYQEDGAARLPALLISGVRPDRHLHLCPLALRRSDRRLRRISGDAGVGDPVSGGR